MNPTEMRDVDSQIALSLGAHFDKGRDKGLYALAREVVAPGDYKIQGTVELKGALTVGEPYEATPTPRLSALRALAALVDLLVERKFVSRRTALRVVLRCAIERALIVAPADEDRSPTEAELAKVIEQVQGEIAKALPKELRNGAVKFNGLVWTPVPLRAA